MYDNIKSEIFIVEKIGKRENVRENLGIISL